ncbi:fumarylacetoacetase [Endozoicomonas sp. OPT23]|uniref:fumarylacetoacetase n=1 Tax=Endozoicomonas sp. OPT23 TaxID=2072845 RepID=UPI00129BAA7A|nr:fumarylacetoacetase [Endozoicomonas sp. OPT23]MRI34850.1 fumarylacetoacetase [Endozoicomonas sp. OPT23]
MMELNNTHNPDLKSWLSSANDKSTDFPIQNLPFAVFREADSAEYFRCGVALGDQIIDLQKLKVTNLVTRKAADALSLCQSDSLHPFMAAGQNNWSALRQALSELFTKGSGHEKLLENCLSPQSKAEFKLPCSIGDYTDFYSSIHHATAVGSLFRPDNPLLPNYKWLPIGYHGRASSIAISGTDFHRPTGQTKKPDAEVPSFGPCQRLDYELEMGIFIGPENNAGSTIAIDSSEQHIFGLCLLNDWSARDMQAWEYQPLGPFLAKSFASTISPWIVTMEALAPFRTRYTRPTDDPSPLPYLSSDKNSAQGSLDIQLAVALQTSQMKDSETEQLSQSSFRHSYWTAAQMVTHHASNGCNLQTGDLLGTGTQSGPEFEEAGSLLELTKGGKQSINLGNGEERRFLNDGDTIIMRGWCETAGRARIGFGEVRATVLPAQIISGAAQ